MEAPPDSPLPLDLDTPIKPSTPEESPGVPLILEEPRHQIKYGRPLQAIWGLFSEYANNSSIHGVRYMGENHRPWVERLWWVIAFSLSIYGCSSLIYNVWVKWEQSPFIVSFVEKPIPVWQIPFPAGKLNTTPTRSVTRVKCPLLQSPFVPRRNSTGSSWTLRRSTRSLTT